MSSWPGKYIIGLTGNIATGKSVVRKMLEHLGAYGIDADALAHRAIAQGAPGFQPVVDTFGKWILGDQGQIDRKRLGRLVFNDPEALSHLESIVHPLVGQAVDILVKHASQPIIVIEAIKLFESNLRSACDTIWVTFAPEEIQIARLMNNRSMPLEEARPRIHAQNPQEDKIALANVVITNTGSFDELWKQVTTEWKKISRAGDTAPIILRKAKAGEFAVQRGQPRDSEAIAEFITNINQGKERMTTEDVMAEFGEKAYLLLHLDDQLVGLVGWQVENLVARTTDLCITSDLPLKKALETLVGQVEKSSQDLQCEASLLFLPPELATYEEVWSKLGYERRLPEMLGVQAWQDAVQESMPDGTILYFKQLRPDRVLLPI